MRSIPFDPDGWSDFEYWLSTDRRTARRIVRLISEIQRDPFNGIGKPEPLKGNLSGYWSRRINDPSGQNGGEPNSDFGYDDEDCLVLNLNQYAGSTGHWNDAPCLWGGYDGFIVEYPETA